MLAEVIRPTFLDEIQASDQSSNSEHIRRAAFEIVRQLPRLSGTGGVPTRAPFPPGAYQVFGTRPNVEHAGASRAEHRFMAGESEQVNAQGLHVDGDYSRCLGGIDQKEQVPAANQSPDLGDRLDRAQDVASVCHGHQPRAGGQSRFDRCRLDPPILLGTDPRQRDTARLGQRHQRAADAVVFHIRGDDVVAVPQHSFDGNVEGIRSIEGENPALRVAPIEEAIEAVPGVVQGMLRRQSHLVSGASGVGQCVSGEVVQGLVNGRGFGIARRSIIQVDHDAFPMNCSDRFLKDRRTSITHVAGVECAGLFGFAGALDDGPSVRENGEFVGFAVLHKMELQQELVEGNSAGGAQRLG